jgi:hypothetical protein
MFRWIGRSALSVLGGAILVGTAWWAVGDHQRAERIRQLEREKAELQRIVERLKTRRRVAQVFVVDQRTASDARVQETTIEFTPLGRLGEVGRASVFTVPGEVCYFDALVIRFEDEYVEAGDPLRGHSLHLFRRAFGEDQPPRDGYPLDEPGGVPAAYRGGDSEPSRFERRLWRRFWEYAENPSLAAELGVRVAQGEAVYQRLRKGEYWQVSIRADGGLEFSRLESPPVPTLPPLPLNGVSRNAPRPEIVRIPTH